MKKKQRGFRAGVAMAKSIIEMVHLMYQTKTAILFLRGIITELIGELDRREYKDRP